MSGRTSRRTIRKTWGAQLCRSWPLAFILLLTFVLVLGISGMSAAKRRNAARDAGIFQSGRTGAAVRAAGAADRSRLWVDDLLESLHLAGGLLAGETGAAGEVRPPTGPIPVALHLARLAALVFVLAALVVVVWPQLVTPLARIRIRLWRLVSRDRVLFGLVSTDIWPLRWLFRRYSVICGLGWTGYEVACSIRSRPRSSRRLIIVDRDPENPFRAELAGCGDVIFITGDAARGDVLRAAAVNKARNVFVTAESDEINSRVTTQLADILGSRLPPDCLRSGTPDPESWPTCRRRCEIRSESISAHVQILDERLRSGLENDTRSSLLDVRCFDIHTLAVRQLLARHCPFAGLSASRPVHFFVTAGTPVGDSLLVELLHQGHTQGKRPVRLTILVKAGPADSPETAIQDARNAFYRRFPCFDPDVRLTTPGLARVLQYVYPWSDDTTEIVRFAASPTSETALREESFCLYESIRSGECARVYICLDDGVQSAAFADRLFEALQYHDPDGSARLYRYYNYPEREIGEDASGPDTEAGLVVPFGSALSEDAEASVSRPLVERAAMYLHMRTEHSAALVSDTDHRHCLSERFWNEADEWKRESSRQAAAHFPVKLHCLGMRPKVVWSSRLGADVVSISPADRRRLRDLMKVMREEKERLDSAPDNETRATHRTEQPQLPVPQSEVTVPEDGAAGCRDAVRLAELEHRRWCMERLLNGWLPLPDTAARRAWDTDENARRRLKEGRRMHRDLIPFHDLPPGERAKDHSQLLALLEFVVEQCEADVCT